VLLTLVAAATLFLQLWLLVQADAENVGRIRFNESAATLWATSFSYKQEI